MDVRTLAVILGITQVVQVIVFSLQASINRSYRGIGWWLLWSAAAALGYAFMLLRLIPSLLSFSIIAQNSLIVLGAVFLYIGVMRFLGRKETPGLPLLVFVVFFLALTFFLFVKDSITGRTIAIGVALAAISLLTAHGLYVNKTPAVTASANFLAAIFMAHGGYFIFRTAMIVSGSPLSDMFSTSLLNVSAFLDGIAASMLWTCGLIIMVNQRSNADMSEAKKHFESIFNTSPDAVSVTSLGPGLILDVNHSFAVLSGFSRAELVGRSILDVHIWKDPADRQRFIAELRGKGAVENFEAEFQLRDGSRLIGLVSARIIVLQSTEHIISVTRDISQRKRDEEKIKAILQEKELLLKEVHHRIKNNMISLMGLLTLQANAAKHPEAVAAIQEAHSRLQGMGVLYDRLYRAENLHAMSLGDFLPSLVNEIVAVFPSRARVRVEARVEPFTVAVDVLPPLGIIVNELVTNSLKHAFGGRENGLISVAAVSQGRRATIVIRDDGSGFFAAAAGHGGFGLQLVDMLVKQIGGTLRCESRQGTENILEFDV